MTNTLYDLDELVLLCRTQKVKALIQEAVAAYKGGAYRASITFTWLAVVYDIIEKLKELDANGDAKAKKMTSTLTEIIDNHNLQGSLKFERDILESTKEFEFFTPIELIELSRLKEDRNRCVHPSFYSLDEIYEPSAELVRYHLRNAVLYVLKNPPLQGKYALDSLVSKVEMENFPIDYLEAKKYD